MPFRLSRVTPASHKYGGKRKKGGDKKQTFYKFFVLLLHTFGEYFAAYVFFFISKRLLNQLEIQTLAQDILTKHLFNQLEIHTLHTQATTKHSQRHPDVGTYETMTSFVTFHGIFIGPGYDQGEGSIWSIVEGTIWSIVGDRLVVDTGESNDSYW